MTPDDVLTLIAILAPPALIGLAWRVLDVRELWASRPRREPRPYDPGSRPWGKGW